MTNPNHTPRVNVAIHPDVYDRLKKLAKRNSRTIKAQLELLINAEVLY